MPELLSDLEKEAIQTFLDNDVMREAVKKVLLIPIYNNGVMEPGRPADPLRNFALALAMDIENQGLGGAIGNEAIGADLRAITKAVRLLEQGFMRLSDYVPTPPPAPKTDKPNKAK